MPLQGSIRLHHVRALPSLDLRVARGGPKRRDVGNLGFTSVRSTVCAQEELAAAAGRRSQHGAAVLLPLQDGQAEGVGLQATLPHASSVTALLVRLQTGLPHASSVKTGLVGLQAALPHASSVKALLVRLQAAWPHAGSVKALPQLLSRATADLGCSSGLLPGRGRCGCTACAAVSLSRPHCLVQRPQSLLPARW